MKIRDTIEALGLSPEETALYRALLQGGALGVSALSKAAGLYRPTVYHHLPRLIEKDLVSEALNGKRRVYFAQSPERLRRLASSLTATLEAALPDLLHSYAASTNRPSIRYLYGVAGIRNAYYDLLSTIKKGDIVCRYESPRNYKEYARYIPDEYRRRILDQTEVDWQIITNESTKKQKKPRLGRSFKAVHGLFVYDITQFIYQGKVSFIDFHHETASI